MKKIELTQSQLVDLFIEKMKTDEYCVSHTNGTYNKGDPTHREEVKAKVFIEHGYSFSVASDMEENPVPYPDPEVVDVHIHDVTWGVEFELYTSIGLEKAYYARANEADKEGEWHRATENFFRVITGIFLRGESPDDYDFVETGKYEPSWR